MVKTHWACWKNELISINFKAESIPNVGKRTIVVKSDFLSWTSKGHDHAAQHSRCLDAESQRESVSRQWSNSQGWFLRIQHSHLPPGHLFNSPDNTASIF